MANRTKERTCWLTHRDPPVLKTIETAALRNRRGDDFKREVNRALENHLPMNSNLSNSPDLYEQRRKDHISHFVLRMAYCRRWVSALAHKGAIHILSDRLLKATNCERGSCAKSVNYSGMPSHDVYFPNACI